MINAEQRKFIKVYLINNNLKQVDLAKKFKRKRQQINNVINGITENLRVEETILDYVGWYEYKKRKVNVDE
jgi:hypothetical protein